MRFSVIVVALVLVASACAPSGTSPTAGPGLEPSSTTGASPTTTQASSTTSTTVVSPTTTQPPLEDPPEPPATFSYAVVAEKQARRLAVIDPNGDCSNDEGGCTLTPVRIVELSEKPHNITSSGSVVYATHPDAGSVSRIDIGTGAVLTVAVGREPHDIKFDPVSGSMIVADESGRSLLVVDPDDLEVLDRVEVPGEPHDLVVEQGVVWATLIGRSELVRVTHGMVELLPAGGSPHDLIVARDGTIWYSNWGSKELNIYDPSTGITPDTPTGVGEPQHFTIDADGAVWISDIAGDAIVGFVSDPPVTVAVGPSPHHLAFVGDTIVVAVSGSGEAVFVRNGEVVALTQLTPGLHGVAAIELDRSL